MKLNASPFAWVSFAMIVGVMGTALISPLYALYQQAWQLQASDVSQIYIIYMAGALCCLLFLGRLPDRVGFLPVMQGGLVLVVLGTLLSIFAWDVSSLSAARFIVGLASSLITTSATVGLARLARPGQVHRVAMLTGFLMALGFGLGPLVGGIVGQWLPSPLVLAYVPTLLLGSGALVVLSRMPLPPQARPVAAAPLQLRDAWPRLTWPEPASSRAFALTSCLPFLAFGVFGLYASMAPLFLDKLLPWHGPVVSGTAIALILLASATVQMLAGRLPTHWCGACGLAGLALSNALLMLNLWVSSTLLFALGVVCTAIGHGMSMLAGMSMVNRIATPGNRSGLLSTYLVIGYIGSMLPMWGVGWVADRWGMEVAVCAFCTMVMCLGTTACVLFQREPLMRAQARTA